MPLVTVYSDEVRLDQATRYEELIREVAQAAVKREEKWNWTAHQVSFGNVVAFHYVAEAPDWATIQRRGEVEDLIRRLRVSPARPPPGPCPRLAGRCAMWANVRTSLPRLLRRAIGRLSCPGPGTPGAPSPSRRSPWRPPRARAPRPSKLRFGSTSE